MELFIREVRQKKKMTLRELAKKSRMSVGAISEIENNNVDMKLSTYCKIANALEINVNSELLKLK